MTKNDAPESTRARIGFLSIITSSWLPVILAVDGGFPVHAASPPWKGSLVFLAPTAWRLTGSAMATGICRRAYWGSASRGTWRKNGEKSLVGVFLLQCQRRQFRRRFSNSCQGQPFSLGSSALHVQDVRSGNKKQGLLSAVLHTSVFLDFRWEFLNRALYFLVTAAYVGRGLVSVGFW
ncbi:hypothetical protein TNCV_3998281 [Trichonephila clavipes]|nr:hypothetical protein TNCV_3998281 [Trichonephila clavipes]